MLKTGRRLERSGKQFIESRFMLLPVPPPFDKSVAWGFGDTPGPKAEYNIGQVSKIEKGPGAGQVTVHFKSSKFSQDIMECHPINKIDQILPDGHIVYQQDCKKLGEYMKERTPPRPPSRPTWPS